MPRHGCWSRVLLGGYSFNQSPSRRWARRIFQTSKPKVLKPKLKNRSSKLIKSQTKALSNLNGIHWRLTKFQNGTRTPNLESSFTGVFTPFPNLAGNGTRVGCTSTPTTGVVTFTNTTKRLMATTPNLATKISLPA